MLNERRKEINRLANDIREILNLDTPIDLKTAVKMLKGQIKENYLENDMEAKIEKKETKNCSFIIHIKPDQNDKRKRFSIAHELGHLFLHMGYLIDQEKWENIEDYNDSVYYRFGHNEEEYEAHEFSAAFLMPKKEFIDIAKQHYKSGLYNLEPIADYFDVSLDAARNRGRWLGIFSWGD